MPPSQLPYEPGEEAAVVRVATYCRDDFRTIAISSSPSENDPVRQSVAEPFNTEATASLGTLDCLPLELLSWLCLTLDVRSCFVFRQVNRRARQVVSSLHSYRTVASQALESLRATLWLGIAPFFTIEDMYRPLTSTQCSVCSWARDIKSDAHDRGASVSRRGGIGCGLDMGWDWKGKSGSSRSSTTGGGRTNRQLLGWDKSPGMMQDSSPSQDPVAAPFLFLPTMTRCCYNCLYFDISLGLMSFHSLQKVLPIPEARLRDAMPVLRHLPMNYFSRQWQQPTPARSPTGAPEQEESPKDTLKETSKETPKETTEVKSTEASNAPSTEVVAAAKAPGKSPGETQSTSHATNDPPREKSKETSQDIQDTTPAAPGSTVALGATQSSAADSYFPVVLSPAPACIFPLHPQLVTLLHAVDAMCIAGIRPDSISERVLRATNGLDDTKLTFWRLNASTFLPLSPRTSDRSNTGTQALHSPPGYLSCYGCKSQETWFAPDLRSKQIHPRVYATPADYLEHFVHCPKAINLWRVSERGTLDDETLAAWRREHLE